MIKGTRMKKYWGGDKGIWWCKLGTCLQIHSVNDMKELDEDGFISWARPNKSSNLIMPICSRHGILLDFVEKGPVKLNDGITIFA